MVARAPGRSALRWLRTVGLALTLADVVAVLLAGLVAGLVTSGRWAPLVAAGAVAVAVARAADLHRARLVLSILEDLPGLLVAAVGATVVLVATDAAAPVTGVLVLACLVLAHTVVHGTAQVLRRTGRSARRAVVVGTGDAARRLALSLSSDPGLGLRPVGFVGTSERSAAEQARGLPLVWLGSVLDLPRTLDETGAEAVLVALAGPPGEPERTAVDELLSGPRDVYAVPAWLPDVRAHARHPRELVDGVPLVHLHRRGTWLPVRAGKRVVEVVVALVSLVALLPVTALLGVLVRVETGGVLVRAASPDEWGRPAAAIRFRTRRARSVGRPGTTFSVAISGRPGPVGRLLRRTGLVALPESVAVLLRRVRYAGGVPPGAGSGRSGAARPRTAPGAGSADPPDADDPEVDPGELAG